jgi:choice-of-anchor C domain-containing protein
MLTFKKSVFGLILLSLSTGSAYAGLIVNGSFEQGDFNSCSNGSWCRLFNGATNLTGWVIGGVAVDWHNSAEMHFPHTGDKVVDLNLDGGPGQTGTISQSFATTPGAQYLLEFFLSGPEPSFNSGFPDPREVVVDIAGVHMFFSTPASLNTNIQWGDEQLLFTAQGTTTTLTFSSPNDVGYWGPVLDDVSVNAVNAVPEPSSIGLLFTGFLGLAATRLHRRA